MDALEPETVLAERPPETTQSRRPSTKTWPSKPPTNARCGRKASTASVRAERRTDVPMKPIAPRPPRARCARATK